MASSDVFSKLSRILETHTFTTDDKIIDKIVNEYINDDNGFSSAQTSPKSIGGTMTKKKSSSDVIRDRLIQEEEFLFPGSSSPRPTPFDVWKVRHKEATTIKEPAKISEYQWDRLADKMSSSNRVRQSAMIRQQNSGLAQELEGHEFKPNLNKKSLELSASLKPLHVRMDDMIKEREKILVKRREELSKEEVADCTFAPTRDSAKASERYLRRIGRSKVTPDDLIKYTQEKKLRNEQRKQIVDEVESRELTFKPRMNNKSLKIEARLKDNQSIVIDPLTRTRSYRTKKTNDNTLTVKEGPVLILESDHPYRHNIVEYSTVNIPNAMSYTITFDDNTSTEPIHDYIRFYRDDKYEEFYGATKYSGGYNGSSANWPGTGDRPPLIIHASKFVVHFKSNGSINDWGFRMKIIPLIKYTGDDQSEISSVRSGKPQISYLGKTYGKKSSNGSVHDPHNQVHDRLYNQAVEKISTGKELQKELVQSKINLPLQHWEGNNKVNFERSFNKSSMQSVYEDEEVFVADTPSPQVTIVDFDDNVAFLYKSLRNASLS